MAANAFYTRALPRRRPGGSLKPLKGRTHKIPQRLQSSAHRIRFRARRCDQPSHLRPSAGRLHAESNWDPQSLWKTNDATSKSPNLGLNLERLKGPSFYPILPVRAPRGETLDGQSNLRHLSYIIIHQRWTWKCKTGHNLDIKVA